MVSLQQSSYMNIPVSCKTFALIRIFCFSSNYVNPFMHNVVKWPNMLSKSCGVNSARFLKYVWPFCNIMHERVILEIIVRGRVGSFFFGVIRWQRSISIFSSIPIFILNISCTFISHSSQVSFDVSTIPSIRLLFLLDLSRVQ